VERGLLDRAGAVFADDQRCSKRSARRGT
jgi:hypothetical protein